MILLDLVLAETIGVSVLQDFVKQVASSPLRMDSEQTLHLSDADPVQRVRQGKPCIWLCWMHLLTLLHIS